MNQSIQEQLNAVLTCSDCGEGGHMQCVSTVSGLCLHEHDGQPCPSGAAKVERTPEQRIALIGSEDRARVLVEVLEAQPDPTLKNELLRDWFNACDALAPQTAQLREQFELAGFVIDEEGAEVDPFPDCPVIVYRGAWQDDDLEAALSWTTDRAIAERFARGLNSPRGWFLGLSRRDDPEARPTIYQGLCTAMYGFLNSRNEHEVIAKTVVDVEPIAELIPVPKGES